MASRAPSERRSSPDLSPTSTCVTSLAGVDERPTEVDERAPEQTFSDGLGIGIGQDNAGVVATQFKGQPLDRIR